MLEFDKGAAGRTIRSLRRERGLSQEVLSGFAGIARTHLTMIENGTKQANFETIWRIALALDLRPSQLVEQIERECLAPGSTEADAKKINRATPASSASRVRRRVFTYLRWILPRGRPTFGSSRTPTPTGFLRDAPCAEPWAYLVGAGFQPLARTPVYRAPPSSHPPCRGRRPRRPANKIQNAARGAAFSPFSNPSPRRRVMK